MICFNCVSRQSITLISNDLFGLTESSFACRAYRQYREHIESNLSKCWIKDSTDFKPLVERVRNDVVPLVAIVGTDLDELKACVVVAVKLTGELDTLLIAL